MLETHADRKGWLITIIGALFFFYGILQINLMTALNHELLTSFNATETKIAILSSWGFYANVLSILPAGLLLDRFSVKKIMLINLTIVIIGTLIFAFAKLLFIAAIGRFLCGITFSFGLIACLKLASYWLPEKEMARASSIIMAIGMLGGVFALVAVTALREVLGWRMAVLLIALLGVFIAAVLWFVVKDKEMPEQHKITERAGRLSSFESLKEVFKQKQNWLTGFFICFINLPLSVLGALFGISYLVRVYAFSDIGSAGAVAMLFLGVIIGSPIFGAISDRMKRRKPPMLFGAVLGFVLMLLLLYVTDIHPVFLHLLFLGVGIASASQVVGYPIIAESNKPKLSATATSFAVLIIAGVGYGITLPIVGKILDLNLAEQVIEDWQISNLAFFRAFLVIPLGLFLAFILALLIKETKCKSIV